MVDIAYIKNYKEKELRQYVLAYWLVTIASVGFQTVAKLQFSGANTNTMISIFQMIMTDIFIGAICVLVMILNEIWPEKAKTKLVYWHLPSDTVFSKISNGQIETLDLILIKQKPSMLICFQLRQPNKLRNGICSCVSAEIPIVVML